MDPSRVAFAGALGNALRLMIKRDTIIRTRAMLGLFCLYERLLKLWIASIGLSDPNIAEPTTRRSAPAAINSGAVSSETPPSTEIGTPGYLMQASLMRPRT